MRTQMRSSMRTHPEAPVAAVADAAAVRTAATALNGGSAAATAVAVADHYNTAGGNKNSNPNGPVGGVPG